VLYYFDNQVLELHPKQQVIKEH